MRLALLGGASIEKRKRFRYGWSHLLSGIGFLMFVMLVFEYGVGYHLLPFTALIAVVVFALSKLFPQRDLKVPYHRVVYPFKSLSGLRRAYDNARGFKKIRFTKPEDKPGNFALKCLLVSFAAVLLAILSPMMLLAWAIPDYEASYQAKAV